MNIMIADESPLMRERVRRSVSQIPDTYVIGEAENEEAAINLIRSIAPDLAIVDRKIPKNNEHDAICRIRAQYPQMKLLVTTNCYDSSVQNWSYEVGADYVFDKVTEFEDMVTVVRLLVQMEECLRGR